ncbi:MAG: uroporphyrinogen-III synthase [Gammaproteobacteria bacterium]|nr:MAG: uroporphyrinogen-III synthase [Gammaproteobacteria bacterium]
MNRRPAPPCNLQGLNVLVTRPAEQAAEFSELISAAHGRPVGFPALEILGPEDKHAVRRQLGALDRLDLLIFVSANAVRYAFPLLPDQIPLDLRIAAVGRATGRALEAVGLEPTLVPDASFDSEGLLALPALQHIEGWQILIVRGNGGRPLLGDTLRARGAQVDYAEVYRRRLPQRNPANLIANWERLVDVVTVTSVQILDNLFTLLGEAGSERLRATPLVVASERIAREAADRGCEQVLVAPSALDRDMLATLCGLVD